jgi:cyclophilin family peptidyl-prolyl cis-trans isomerase
MRRRVVDIPWRPWLLAGLLLVFAVLPVAAQEDGGSTPPSDPPGEAATDQPPAPEAKEKAEGEQAQPTPAGEEAPAKQKKSPKEEPAAEAEPAPAEEKAPAKKKAAAAVAPSTEEPSEPVAAGPAEAFAEKLAALKQIMLQMRELQIEYASAEPAQAPTIQQQWDELEARGEALITELREAGKQAFIAAPNQDESLTKFLMKRVAKAVERDDYQPAADLAMAMMENGCQHTDLLEPAGVAAFAVHEFDKAAEYLAAAKEKGTLGDTGRNYLSEVENYKEYWKREQELRQAETEANDLPRVRLTTSKGEIVVELFENEAPGAVGNFVSLVEDGFYDGLVFHRVLQGFMAQGGCPEGTGGGGPGYEIYCECYADDHRKHFTGSLSMAHAGRDTGGSQFFITFVPTPFLNGRHTVFGRVIEGLDVLPQLQRIDPQAGGKKPEPDKIIKAEVIRKRDHEYKPNKVQ